MAGFGDGLADWEAIMEDAITPAACEELAEKGFCFRDGALPEGSARQLHAEASQHVPWTPHTFRFGASKEHPIMFKKPQIFEADMHNPALVEAPIPGFRGLFDSAAVGKALAARLPQLGLAKDTSGITLKIQRNQGGGGCFPHHYDNPGPPNRRAVTALFYLNPEWADGDGGELELQPLFGPPVSLAPLMGRLVLFRSDVILHRVRPSRAVRHCFTVWVDGSKVNGPDDVNLKAKHLEMRDSPLAAATLFRQSPLQRVISRALYAEEYEDSLRACMAEPAGVGEMEQRAAKAMLAEHSARVKALRDNPQLASFIDKLRAFKRSPEAEAEFGVHGP